MSKSELHIWFCHQRIIERRVKSPTSWMGRIRNFLGKADTKAKKVSTHSTSITMYCIVLRRVKGTGTLLNLSITTACFNNLSFGIQSSAQITFKRPCMNFMGSLDWLFIVRSNIYRQHFPTTIFDLNISQQHFPTTFANHISILLLLFLSTRKHSPTTSPNNDFRS